MTEDQQAQLTHPAACGCKTSKKIIRGMCPKHYWHWRKITPLEARPPARAKRTFWDYVDKSSADGCWIWTGTRKAGGYGVWRDGRVKYLAHRVSLAEVQPEPLGGKLACHTCDNPPCVNPAHLYWGTHSDNRRDFEERVASRPRRTHCRQGHALTDDNVRVKQKGGSVRVSRICRTCDNKRAAERQREARRVSAASRLAGEAWELENMAAEALAARDVGRAERLLAEADELHEKADRVEREAVA